MTFDGYTGPFLDAIPDERPVVPILPSTRDFFRGSAACQRVQFPLAVAHAVTVHKSQGLTIDRAVMDISSREHQSGLTYVAVSRVKSLQSIMFDTSFDLQSLQRPPGRDSHPTRARLADWA